ncbi:MAG: RsmE family RNA methyltransferase [Candidatus Absconditabacterales bacterium]
MQLFLTNFKLNNDEIIIENLEMINQIKKVLRLSKGDNICVQDVNEPKNRYEIKIKDMDKCRLIGYIGKVNKLENNDKEKTMIIAMPNKRDKIEIIVQKLTEIGIDNIIFWPSERSVVKSRNIDKFSRLEKIAKEAVEQSWGNKLPKISFSKNIIEIKNSYLMVFDKISENIKFKTNNNLLNKSKKIIGLIGPEGGLTEKDYKYLNDDVSKIISLGENILRMETASIIAGWIIKNDLY